MYYENDLRMYTAMCTKSIKQQIVRAAMDKNKPEYHTLSKIPAGTIWYVQPEMCDIGVSCTYLVMFVEEAAKEAVGLTTRYDLISMLKGLQIACVKTISVGKATCRITSKNDCRSLSP